MALESATRFFPPGTVHLAVVDPGVGSSRHPVAIRAGGHLFVGPDNGLFTFALERADGERVFGECMKQASGPTSELPLSALRRL